MRGLARFGKGLAVAPGVVFDLDGRPNGNHEVLSHLLTRPDNANEWMATPRLIRPSTGSNPSSWKTEGWNLPAPRARSAQLTSSYYGFTALLKLRKAADAKPGFTERAYHDRLLSWGSPAMKFVRQLESL